MPTKEPPATSGAPDVKLAFEEPPADYRADLAMAILSIALSAAYLWAGWGLPANPFEPIGSGTIPSAVALIGIALGALLLIETSRRLRSGDPRAGGAEHWGRSFAAFLCTAVYAWVLSAGFVRYAWATIVFGFVVTLICADDRRRSIPGALIFSVLLGFGIDLLFRNVFSTDIP